MQNYRYRLIKINSFVSKKKSLIIFLLLLIGVFISGFSGTTYLNFWDRLITIITNPFYNLMLFFSLGYGLIMMLGDNFNSFNIIIRYKDYKLMIKEYIKDVIVYSVYLTFISFFLAVAGSIVLSFGNYKIINYIYYDIPVVYYIMFFFVRSLILNCIMNIIIFILYINFRKKISSIVIILTSALFEIIPQRTKIISHFYQLPLLPYQYYNKVSYSSFYLEILCSILYILISLSILCLIKKYVKIKKKDLL